MVYALPERTDRTPGQSKKIIWSCSTGPAGRSAPANAVTCDDLRPVLERLDLDVEAWAENVARYGSLFHRLAGKITCLRAWARAKGLAWLHGHRGARVLYAKPA